MFCSDEGACARPGSLQARTVRESQAMSTQAGRNIEAKQAQRIIGKLRG